MAAWKSAAEFEPAFDISEPAERDSAAIFNSPHSGARYPESFLAASRLDARALRRSEDAFVDELFACAPMFGAPLMRAHFPRAYVDVNREPYELDPRMFEGRLPPFANTRSLRVAGGLGTIARIVGESQEIYGARFPVGEALARIEAIYKPYHRALKRLIARAYRAHGVALLIDCHSMPSIGVARDDRSRADIVLGDRYGASCSPAIVDFVEQEFRRQGFDTTRNRPYAGGYITEHYGAPASDLHALQIEINRALYMDEQRHEKRRDFAAFVDRMSTIVERISRAPLASFGALRSAAE
ncbi:N-formylglutamate amidohydrolase [Methylopila sp. M107]|uniref:N-formylglutamate amidohydrolase n=1 Tax=Methylopila sp. M107 TaxID=1101190 RepID=UPI0003686E03|nr:N-formylglutamate amidohydrolase [Methylopila sp. M107]